MVSPASPAVAASCSGACLVHASTTASRIDSCSARIGSRSFDALLTPAPLRVVDSRDRPQLPGFLLGRRVVQKIPAPDLGAGEVLEKARFAQRWVDLDVEVETRIRAVRGRLVQHHHVWKRHLPKVVESNQCLAQDDREVAQLGGAQLREARACLARRDERLVRVAREIGNKSEEHTSELQSRFDLVCRLLLEKKNKHTMQST